MQRKQCSPGDSNAATHSRTSANVLQETQALVLQRLLRLVPDISPEAVKGDLLIGTLLFSGLPYKKPFIQDTVASQVCAHMPERRPVSHAYKLDL